MSGAISHRGPDHEGFFSDQHAGLGHRRLSIIDLHERSHQPMFSHSGRYVIVFNGEIYNFREIAAQLDIDCRTHSDTEVLVEAFEKTGPSCVHLLNGMFAFAIYDLEEQTLWLFRDRLGVKPLFYAQRQDVLLFASEIKGLLKWPGMDHDKELNKEAVSDFLELGYIPAPATMYRNILKFPSGHYASVSKYGNMDLHCYWSPENAVRAETLNDEQIARERLHDLLYSSVSMRMFSDVPFGTLLSGGIDSSLVTAIAQRVSETPINTFSIGFDEVRFDESKHAREVSSYLGTKHHELTVTQKEASVLLFEMMDTYDEPFADSSAIPSMLVSKMASGHVKMVLSGDGGDELFMGYGAYRWAERLSNPLVNLSRHAIAAALSLGNNRNKRAAHMFRYSGKTDIRRHIFSQEQYLFSHAELDTLLHPEYRSPQHGIGPGVDYARKLEASEMQALHDMKHYLCDDLLVKMDRASMRYSLEVREPLLDYRLAEFALNLSPGLRMGKGKTKYLLRKELYDIVPETFFNRPKQGFAIPLEQWLRKELAWLIDEYLSVAMVDRYGIVRSDACRNLVRRFRSGEGYLYNRIWALIVLHRFMKENF
jgi:asparagine synthase (glutamine-hydrolysing)